MLALAVSTMFLETSQAFRHGWYLLAIIIEMHMSGKTASKRGANRENLRKFDFSNLSTLKGGAGFNDVR